MTSDGNGKLEQERHDRRTRKMDWQPIIGILIVVMFLSFILDGPRSDASNRQGLTSEATFSSSAFLGGIERRNKSSAFRGGNATAFMGGIDLDLRDATMDGNEARINISA